MSWDWNAARAALPAVWSGFLLTLWIVLVSAAIALTLGLAIAALQRVAGPGVRRALLIATQCVRNTPLLVQVYFLYYFALPALGLGASALVTGIAALGVHYATYTAEVYRGGIESVPRTQWDAATALQLSRGQVMRYVILPQAVPPMLPALGNYLIAMLKDAPLLSAISVAEVLTRALEHGARHFRYLEALTIVGALYLVISLIASALLTRLQDRVERLQGAARGTV